MTLCVLVLLFTVIRAKVVGKKLLKDGPFGTMRYTVKQMKVSQQSISECYEPQRTTNSTKHFAVITKNK